MGHRIRRGINHIEVYGAVNAIVRRIAGVVSEAVRSDVTIIRIINKRILTIAIKAAEGPKSSVRHWTIRHEINWIAEGKRSVKNAVKGVATIT